MFGHSQAQGGILGSALVQDLELGLDPCGSLPARDILQFHGFCAYHSSQTASPWFGWRIYLVGSAGRDVGTLGMSPLHGAKPECESSVARLGWGGILLRLVKAELGSHPKLLVPESTLKKLGRKNGILPSLYPYSLWMREGVDHTLGRFPGLIQNIPGEKLGKGMKRSKFKRCLT